MNKCPRYQVESYRGLCIPCEDFSPCVQIGESQFNEENCRLLCEDYYIDIFLKRDSLGENSGPPYLVLSLSVVLSLVTVLFAAGLIAYLNRHRCKRNVRAPVQDTQPHNIEAGQGGQDPLLNSDGDQTHSSHTSAADDTSSGFESRPTNGETSGASSFSGEVPQTLPDVYNVMTTGEVSGDPLLQDGDSVNSEGTEISLRSDTLSGH